MHMASKTKRWTLADLRTLPDDGNTYELIDGELLVTPAPSTQHEEMAALLAEIMQPYVVRESLGRVYRPRAVLQRPDEQAEPDLMIRRPIPRGASWLDAPTPFLVVEITSPTTKRRDLVQKREFYIAAGVPEYWIVDAEQRCVRVIRPGTPDVIERTVLRWAPARADGALELDLERFFRDALGEADER